MWEKIKADQMNEQSNWRKKRRMNKPIQRQQQQQKKNDANLRCP